MKISGEWEGKLVDATGVRAVVQAALKEGQGKVEGGFSLFFVSQGEGGCCNVERRLGQAGTVSGRFDAQKGVLAIDYTVSVGLDPVKIHLEGAVRDAMPHARQAIVGCYHVAPGAHELTFEGGGMVLWQYR